MILVQDPDLTIHVGDVRDVLATLEDGSVDCCVTSPPYWGLRDYGTGSWAGGDPDCDHKNTNVDRSLLNDGALRDRTTPMRDVCGKCGAQRIDQQLGLEPTPDLYVANMVAVFREVRRVLADHGTCWVNLGDSYFGTGRGPSDLADDRGFHTKVTRDGFPLKGVYTHETLKSKDLVGIPWRVAFALQQPWERHVIESATDRAWMAGLMDGEGCVSVVAVQPTTGVNESHSMRVQIRMADTEAVERVVVITGMSNVTYDLDTGQGARPAQQWKISGDKAADVLADIYPFLTIKRRQAIVGWNLQRLKDGVVTKRGQPIPEDNMAKRRLLHDVLRKLNQREPVDIPSWCREPAVEREEGWYLRSDVVWAKPNPMPESVTDRPTKAHEYVFLLSKRPRYWFDQEAVREPAEYGRREVTGPPRNGRTAPSSSMWRGVGDGKEAVDAGSRTVRGSDPSAGRNVRSVWEIATQPYAEAHFATYPEELVRRCLLAGCPEWVCGTCGKARERVTEHGAVTSTGGSANGARAANMAVVSPLGQNPDSGAFNTGTFVAREKITLGWSDCGHGNYRPGQVLDPFGGSGTTALVARKLGRRSVLIELNPDYAELAARRLQQLSLLA